MTMFTCISLDCRERSAPPFESNEKKPVCPVCGYDNALRPIATLHLLIRDRLGTIRGQGANYRIACGIDPKKASFVTSTPSEANCKKCRELIPPEEESTDPTPPNI